MLTPFTSGRNWLSRVFICAAIAYACFGTVVLRAADAPSGDDAREMKRFVDAFRVLTENAADPVNIDQAFYQGAIPGLLKRLDPHTVFFDRDQYAQLKQMETSTAKGFGTVVSILPGRVVVLQTLPNTPSSRAGMVPGDEIIAVNNYRLDRLDMDQTVELLKESKQRPADLVVHRAGATSLLTLRLVPQEMQTSTVDRAFELKPGIGYVRVNEFDEKTGGQIRLAIEKLGGNNLHGLVLDLRNNPGGMMTAALETASLFLKPGQMILSAKGRNVPEQVERVPQGNVPYPFPVAVIVNAKTASASEIVAGSLQDHDRATIVGEPSFGKGLVQSVYPLSEGAGLALTTALYYIPSGRSIQKPFNKQHDALNSQGFALGATASHPNERLDFKTDSGRPVPGGGGIVPDAIVGPTDMTPFRAALEGSGSFTSYATEYLRDHKVDAKWELAPRVLDDFQAWLAQRRIQPSLHEWIENHDYIESRLRTEILNQSIGVEEGDRAEAAFDPQIQRALAAVQHR
jgi:carboxyl-terminal processing protease